MNVSVTDRFKVEHATELYGLEGWGGGYFAIQPDGHLALTDSAPNGLTLQKR
ncbi:MAG: hypothetical protein IH848_10695 [Acidobacteria bacterium]|nr:hypothetical protein [Acidobacteriota bacterium]